MRRSVVLLLVAVTLAALLSAAVARPGNTGLTRLTIVFARDGERAHAMRWSLACHPPRGTHPRPIQACGLLVSKGWDLFRGVPAGTACTEIYGGPQVAWVSGSVNGRKVWARFQRQNGCEIARWDRVAALLPSG
jgi:hypothetical protein